MRALASHQCGPGSIPRLGIIYALSLLVLHSAPRGFPLYICKPSKKCVRTCKDYVIGREITTVLKIAVDDVILELCHSCDYFASPLLKSCQKPIKFNRDL